MPGQVTYGEQCENVPVPRVEWYTDMEQESVDIQVDDCQPVTEPGVLSGRKIIIFYFLLDRSS